MLRRRGTRRHPPDPRQLLRVPLRDPWGLVQRSRVLLLLLGILLLRILLLRVLLLGILLRLVPLRRRRGRRVGPRVLRMLVLGRRVRAAGGLRLDGGDLDGRVLRLRMRLQRSLELWVRGRLLSVGDRGLASL